MIRQQDIAIWEAAKPYLDVRQNDEHTFIAYQIAKQLLANDVKGNPDVVLPAIILHDTGWKKIPQDKIMQAFGPDRKFPELQRQHEIEGVIIAKEILEAQNFSAAHIESITNIIDGHDTNKEERSIDDGIMKDADKLWRFTSHGISLIPKWFQISDEAFFTMLEEFVKPQLLRADSKVIADTLLGVAEGKHHLKTYVK